MTCFLNLHLESPDEQVEEKIHWEDIILFLPIRAHLIRHFIISFPEVGRKYLSGSSKLFSTCPDELFIDFFPTLLNSLQNCLKSIKTIISFAKKGSGTLSELHSKKLHKLSERSCLWSKSITNQILMESQWKTPDFCREVFYSAINTAFYVNRKTTWRKYFSEEINRF